MERKRMQSRNWILSESCLCGFISLAPKRAMLFSIILCIIHPVILAEGIRFWMVLFVALFLFRLHALAFACIHMYIYSILQYRLRLMWTCAAVDDSPGNLLPDGFGGFPDGREYQRNYRRFLLLGRIRWRPSDDRNGHRVGLFGRFMNCFASKHFLKVEMLKICANTSVWFFFVQYGRIWEIGLEFMSCRVLGRFFE